jgi:lambda repressor-like predicted transcriptional regulator
MRAQLNEQAHKAIVAALRKGLTLAEAAAKAGVHRATLWEWLSRGADEEEGPYANLHLDATLARMALHEQWLAYNEGAASGSNPDAKPNAAQWFLQRRFPQIYGDAASGDTLPERTKRDLPKDKARDLAKAGRLRAVKGGG